MANDRNSANRDPVLDPEDVNSQPIEASPATNDLDPNDVVPVPVAMSAAEIDERAQAVEALRGTQPPRPIDEQAPEP